MRISDWSSDVCSSDLLRGLQAEGGELVQRVTDAEAHAQVTVQEIDLEYIGVGLDQLDLTLVVGAEPADQTEPSHPSSPKARSEEHTSELQSLMRISYAVFCLKKHTSKNANTEETEDNTD